METLFVLEGTEYERGWGSRPDGYLILANEKDADAFLEAECLERLKAKTVPDDFTNWDKVGYKVIGPNTKGQIAEGRQSDWMKQHKILAWVRNFNQ